MTALARADVRLGQRWSAPQAAKNAVLRVAIRSGLAIAERVPERLLAAALTRVGRLLWRTSTELRQRALANVRAAGLDAAIAERCFESAGKSLAACLALRRAPERADRVTIGPGAQRLLDETLAEGRGAVFVSAHAGPFELLPAAVARCGYPVTVVVRESYDPALNPLIDRHRLAAGLGVVHRGGPHAAFAIVRALRRGRLVGFLPDLHSRVRVAPVEFMGCATTAPVGPAQIAIRTGAPVLVGTLESDELQLQRVEVCPDPAALTQRVMSALERSIRRAPDQWLWMARSPSHPSGPSR